MHNAHEMCVCACLHHVETFVQSYNEENSFN